MENTYQFDSFMSYTIGIVVFFVGMKINAAVGFLRNYNIPEPVTGGILAAIVALIFYQVTGIEIGYDLTVRDTVLVYFFTCIGINAKISDLVSGGRPLIILLVLTLGYIVVQDIVGIAGASAIGQPKAVGIITGSAALIGGHGTAIAWAPEVAEKLGLPNALEMGVAAATLGLVVASLLGGPISKYLLSKFQITCDSDESHSIGLAHEDKDTERISHINLMGVILVLHIAIILGYILNMGFTAIGFKLPLFVSCLLVAILLSNMVPYLLPKVHWPARSKAIAVVSDFSLGLFIAMSLMGMQLWSLADLAGPLFVLLGLQILAAILFIRFILFPLMGKDYLATVLSAGFAGFALGATPTAIANMTAVTKSHGPAPTAFVILPLVGAFFVDLTNAFVIKFFLGM